MDKEFLNKFVNLIQKYTLDKNEKIKPNYVIIDPPGKLYIPPDKEDEFITAYTNMIFRGYSNERPIIDDKHIAQLPREIGLLKLDFDFKFPVPNGRDRHITNDKVNEIIVDIIPILEQVFSLPEKHCIVYCMYRPKVEVFNNKDIKDGLHLEFPYIIADKKTRYWIHEELIKKFSSNSLAEYTSYGIDKIFDKRIIEFSPWMLYGSSKSGLPYRVNRSINFRTMQELNYVNEMLLPRMLSNHNKIFPTNFKHGFILPEKEKTIAPNNVINTTLVLSNTTAFYWKILDALSPKRSNDYHDWLTICFCLAKISTRIYKCKHPNFLNLFIHFSKKASNFDEKACYQKWQSADPSRKNCPGEAKLKSFLKEDVSAEEYNNIVKLNIVQTIARQKKAWTPHDVAELVSELFGNQYRFYNHSNTQYELYKFENHIWNLKSSNSSLVRLLTNKFRKEIFNDALKHIYKEINDKISNDGMTGVNIKKVQNDNGSAIASCITNLGKPAFKNDVIRELTSILEDDNFINKLNTAEHLIAFQNGIVDLNTGEFRDGVPEDYISLQCGCDYIPYDPNHSISKEIMEFFTQVLPNHEIRHYFLSVVASALIINKNDNICYFLQGPGSTGKSTTIKLIQKGFGSYYSSLNIAYFTQKRPPSNAPTNELMTLIDRRFICSSETNPGEKLNIGIFKDFTGGNSFKGRANFQSFRDITIVGKLFMQVNNMPKLDYVSRAESRRIVIIPFRQIFEDPLSQRFDPQRHAKMNPMIYLKLDKWVPYFMGYLVWHYLKYVKDSNNKIPIPAEMITIKNQYLQSTNILQSYLDTVLKETKDTIKENHKVKKLILLASFQSWMKSMQFRLPIDSISFGEYLKENYPSSYDDIKGELIGYDFVAENI